MQSDEIQKLLASNYAIKDAELLKIEANFSEKIIYKVISNGQSLLLRIYLQEKNGDTIPDIEILEFLERNNYPAARIIKNKDDEPAFIDDKRIVVLTTFIEGKEVEGTPEELYLLGQTLGKLHKLDVSDATLPNASMLPKNELSWVKGKLEEFQNKVPGELKKRYEQLLQEIESFDLIEDLRKTLIHNDAHSGNAIITPEGQVIYIDWEGAGLGSPIIDLAFLLMTVDKGAPWSPISTHDPKRVEAILRGYLEFYHPTGQELKQLLSAMKFRLLVYGCSEFANMIRQGKSQENLFWWEKYQSAEELDHRVLTFIKE
ncbi:MAG: aminoglycoside phosphotransferase family protein [Chloroflexi bacterium]|nr:aminoglycoside phosphotransferase family protein [Chloroflexota bacterium]